MSSFIARAVNPKTKVVEDAEFIDDHFGARIYGVRFKDGGVYRESDLPKLPPDEPGPVK